ncbi:MAG: hypothetical protein IPM38_01830 [Ignavibacteria bacterium]|nr:hypothetical protein [Ignavibacteria bacterium]
MWLDFIEVKNNTARDLLNGNYDMWLDRMDNISTERNKEINSAAYPEKCYEYIYGKIRKKELSLK